MGEHLASVSGGTLPGNHFISHMGQAVSSRPSIPREAHKSDGKRTPPMDLNVGLGQWSPVRGRL